MPVLVITELMINGNIDYILVLIGLNTAFNDGIQSDSSVSARKPSMTMMTTRR